MAGNREAIATFLKAPSFAVVGASDDPSKFGHLCFACYLSHGYKVYPVNPKPGEILGKRTYPDLASLPEPVQSISVITPPGVTEKIVEEAIAAGVKHIWMQPGAENALAVEKAAKAGIEVIWGGPCLLVELRCL